MSDLKSRLLVCADIWSERHDRAPLSRLGKQVAGDANFFARIASPNASLNLKTLENFARHLNDPTNWPEGAVPEEVIAFGHVTGVSASIAGASSGKSAAVSHEVRA